MEPINKQFTQCPNCGSESRFCETLANELKRAGFARKEWKYGFDFRQGVVVDQAKEKAIPIGSEVPGFQITTDICIDCGIVYAVDIKSYPVKKQLPPPKIQLPGQGFNDPRFS